MIVKNGRQLVMPSAVDSEEARIEAWSWLYFQSLGANFPLDSFRGGDMMREIENFASTRAEIGLIPGKDVGQWLLPEESLNWITAEKRQHNWLLSYIRSQFNFAIFPVPPRLLSRTLVIATIDIWAAELNAKSNFVNKMKWDWNVFKQSDRIFTWFQGENETSRCESAWNWLLDKKSLSTIGRTPISSYEELLIFFDGLCITDAEKMLDVNAIKKRWSQQQYRKKMTGKRQCNLLLSDKAIGNLDKLAEKYKVSRSQVLDALIQIEAERGVYLPGKVKATSFW